MGLQKSPVPQFKALYIQNHINKTRKNLKQRNKEKNNESR